MTDLGNPQSYPPTTDGKEKVAQEAENVNAYPESRRKYSLSGLEAEKAKIREDAQKNGSFLKAPNGAPSNLNAEQWVLVRTKRFKRWFGDWEAAENAKISDVAKSFNDLRAILKKLVGKEMSSKDGIKATLSGRSIDKICSGKSFEKSVSRIAHFAAAENIEHLFENSIELTSEPGNKSGVKAMHRLYAPFFFEGQTLVAKISVKEFSNSEENRIYTVEAIDIEKPAGDLAPKQSEKIGKSNPTQASLLKDIKSLMKSVNDVSKVVDENGEPLVVYHGTGEKFYEFDKAKIGSSTRNKGIFGNGFYMTDDYDYASYYNRSGGRINKDGGNVMPLFVSLKTPFEWSDSNALRAAKSAGFPKSRIKNGKLLPLTDENQILSLTENLKNSGHDGVVFDFENGVREFVAFEPEQIKSATQNAGTYARENPDIRYSISTEEQDAWNGVLDAYEAGKLSDRGMNTVLERTPEVILACGAQNLPIKISKRVLDKIVSEKHGVPVSDLRKLLTNIDDPIAVFRSRTQENSLVVLTEIIDTENGGNAIVAIRLDTKEGRGKNEHEINAVSSIYGKSPSQIEGFMRDGLALYVNQQKSRDYARSKRLQLPPEASKRGNPSLLTEEDFSNDALGEVIGKRKFSLAENEEETDDPFAALDEDVREAARKLTSTNTVSTSRFPKAR